MNDIVYYKRDIEVKWKGPAQDGPVVFLWHGDSSSKLNVTLSKPKTYMMKQVALQTQQIIKKPTIQSEKDESIDNNEFTVTTNPVVNPQPPTDQQHTPSAEDSTTEQNQHSNVETNNLNIEQPNVDSTSIIDPTKFKNGQLVSFNLDNDNYKVEIMSRTTKATGNNPDWYNVIHDHPETEKVKSKK